MNLPFISVIIPTKNEEKYIGKCLDRWISQDYPKNLYEILVFDGMSTDKTVEIVRNYQKRYTHMIKLFKNVRIRQVFAFNDGIKLCKGEYFIIFGAHAYPDRTFLSKIVSTFLEIKNKEPMLAGVGGRTIKMATNKLSELITLIYKSYFSGASAFRYKKKPGFVNTVGFALYDKKIAIQIGGFDEDMIIGNDFEFNLRLTKKGYKLYFNPDILCYYYARSTFKGFLKQSFNYGAAKGLVVRKGYFSPTWFLAPGFFFFNILFLVTFLFSPIFSFSTIIFYLFILYWLVLAGESVRLVVKERDFAAFAFPVIMYLFHNVISLGFLIGLMFKKHAFL